MPHHSFRDVLSYYSGFCRPRDVKADQEQGVADGLADLPRTEQRTLGTYELGVVQEGMADIAKLAISHGGDHQSLGRATAVHMQARQEDLESDIRDNAARHDLARAELERGKGEMSRLAQEQELRKFEVVESYNDLQRELDREPLVRMTTPPIRLFPFAFVFPGAKASPYILAMAALSCLEIFINQGVIRELIGQMTPLFSVIAVTAILGLSLVFFGHLLGLFVRQCRVVRRPAEYLRTYLGLPILALVVGLTIYELAVIRQVNMNGGSRIPMAYDAIDAATRELGKASSLSAAVAPVAGEAFKGLIDAGTAYFKLYDPFRPLDARSFLFMLMNVCVFVAGAFLSYRRHDPHPDFEELRMAVEAAEGAISGRRRDYDQSLERLDAAYRRRHDAVTRRISGLQRRITTFIREAQGEIGAYGAERDRVIAIITERVLAYQTGNSRSRATKAPSYYGADTVRLVREMMLLNGSADDPPNGGGGGGLAAFDQAHKVKS